MMMKWCMGDPEPGDDDGTEEDIDTIGIRNISREVK